MTATPSNKSVSFGTHCLVDLFDCASDRLDDLEFLSNLLVVAAGRAGATVVSSHQHRFEPHGVSALCVLAESHISIHTWPEDGSASADIYTCGTHVDPRIAAEWLIEQLAPDSHDCKIIERGVRPHIASVLESKIGQGVS